MFIMTISITGKKSIIRPSTIFHYTKQRMFTVAKQCSNMHKYIKCSHIQVYSDFTSFKAALSKYNSELKFHQHRSASINDTHKYVRLFHKHCMRSRSYKIIFCLKIHSNKKTDESTSSLCTNPHCSSIFMYF